MSITECATKTLDNKQVIDLFERVIGTDPQAYLENSIVYQVTQDELLKFAADLVAKQAEVVGQPQPKDKGLVSEEEFLFGWLKEMSELFTDVEVEVEALDRTDLVALRAATSNVVKMLDEHERLQ
jgi:hypothetical protein